MLAIRLQRTGRKGHAQFRVIVQESRRSPKSGAIVLSLGSYDPHAKVASIDKEKAAFYLNHGAQPSDRVAVLLQKEGVKMPAWVKLDTSKTATVRNADKRRSTRPAETSEEVLADKPAEEVAEKTSAAEETPEAEQAPASEEALETPADTEIVADKPAEAAAEEVAAEAEPSAQPKA